MVSSNNGMLNNKNPSGNASNDKLVSTDYQPLGNGRQPPVRFGENTGFQAIITSPWVLRWAAIPATYATYRTIRKNPTIALARELAVAPILASEWAVEADKDTPPEWKDFIESVFLPLRDEYLATALYFGDIDFGYQCWEKVIRPSEGYLKIVKLKQLLQDITEICIGRKGEYIGVRQVGQDLGLANSVHVGFRVEGSYLYGIPLLENVRNIYNMWVDCNEGARRYDRKIAGCHIIVEYPPGSSYNSAGAEVENSVLAFSILQTLESAGGVAIPRDMAAFMQVLNLDSPGWKIWIMEQGSGHQHSFVDRLTYLDTQFTRGIHIPERAILQGSHGTLAEAEAHGDVVFTIQDIKHRRVTEELNIQAVNQMLYLNFGKQAVDKVRLKASPIADKQKMFFAELYTQLLSSPLGANELQKIDLESMRDQLGIPTLPEDQGESGNTQGPQLQAVPGYSQGTPGGAGKQMMAVGPDGKPVVVDGQDNNLAQSLANIINGDNSIYLSAKSIKEGATEHDGDKYFDMPNRKLSKSVKIVHMSPQEYLDKAPTLNDMYGNYSPEPSKLIKIKKVLKDGTLDELPFLQIHNKQVVDHDGRHRMVVLKSMGVKSVPVLVKRGKLGTSNTLPELRLDDEEIEVDPHELAAEADNLADTATTPEQWKQAYELHKAAHEAFLAVGNTPKAAMYQGRARYIRNNYLRKLKMSNKKKVRS